MTDRELLELAAKAIGHKVHFNFVDSCQLSTDGTSDGFVAFWNPLEKDADAFRLAVQLDIEVRHVNGAAHAGRANYFWCTEDWFPDGDKVAATRRAIVRAAAELAKQEKSL